MTTINYLLLFAIKAIDWIGPIFYLLGAVISVWAFRRCRKRGYLLLGVYFALCVFQLTVSPVIHRHIRQREFEKRGITELDRQLSELEYQKNQLIGDAIENGDRDAMRHYPVESSTIYLEPIIWLLALWLIARREPPCDISPSREKGSV